VTTLRTANRRKARSAKRRVYWQAFAEHEARVRRLLATGRTDKLKRSGYVLRMKKERVR